MQPLFAFVDHRRGGRQHLDDQARQGAEQRMVVLFSAGEHHVRIIEGAVRLDLDLHVGDEDFARCPACRRVQLASDIQRDAVVAGAVPPAIA
jgi:hypothetical protein